MAVMVMVMVFLHIQLRGKITDLNRGVINAKAADVGLQPLQHHVSVCVWPDVHMCREYWLGAGRQRPHVQVVHVCDAFDAAHDRAHGRDVHVQWRALHEHMHNVTQHRVCRHEHDDAEDKGADGICQVPSRVILIHPDQSARNGNAHALQQIADDVQHGAAQIEAALLRAAATTAAAPTTAALTSA